MPIVAVAVVYAVAQVIEKMTGRELTLAEEMWCVRHPLKALKVKDCTNKAFAAERAIFSENGEDDEGDAFRHCFWSAILTRDIGQDHAGLFTSLHEEKGEQAASILEAGTNTLRKNMDLQNNGIGRWTNFDPDDDKSISLKVLRLLIDGKLRVIKPQPAKHAIAVFAANRIKENPASLLSW